MLNASLVRPLFSCPIYVCIDDSQVLRLGSYLWILCNHYRC